MRWLAGFLMVACLSSAEAGQGCLMKDRAAMMACLKSAEESCLSQEGGGAMYRACLDEVRQDIRAELDDAVWDYEQKLFADLGTQYIKYFAVEHALWEAWRDQSCETRAYLTYTTGTAAASLMTICRMRADASRWHDLTHVKPEYWQGP